MCDNKNDKPQSYLVDCKVCRGTGEKNGFGFTACPSCNGTGKQVIK
ncbi:hypothetical protein OIE66_30740 [Nonomuraea sp. NBC_01738]|nr:hypothetical protein OIE66_30740 [Nonomuraea sp. NBC_01738]